MGQLAGRLIIRSVVPVTVLALLALTGCPGARRGAGGRSQDASRAQRVGELRPFPVKGEYGMKFPPLGRAATKEDVEAARAIFSLQGMGEARVWKLPEYPTFARWSKLKNHPEKQDDGTTYHDTRGYVCQAEELLRDGVWQRYFGFVCVYGAAMVPAEEIELSFPEESTLPSDPSFIDWWEAPGGFDIGLTVPRTKDRSNSASPLFYVKPDEPWIIEVYLRNRTGTARSAPADLYHEKDQGGPSLRKGFSVKAHWAAFAPPENPDPRVELVGNWIDLNCLYATHESQAQSGKMLETGEVLKAFSFEFRNLFSTPGAGRCEYWVEVAPADLGLRLGEPFGAANVVYGFDVGLPPVKLTVTEYNAQKQPLGGREQEVRKAIQEYFAKLPQPQPGKKPVPESFPAFSRKPQEIPNGSGDEPEIDGLVLANHALLGTLPEYDPAGMSALLESRMLAEKESIPLKLLLASEGANFGSEKGALCLLDYLTRTDYILIHNVHGALKHALYAYYDSKAKAPSWLVEMTIGALADERYATGMEKTNFSKDTVLKLSYLADEDANLARALGLMRCYEALPFLIDFAQKTGSSSCLIGLGEMRDKRVIGPLVQMVEEWRKNAQFSNGMPTSDSSMRAIVALGQLHAVEAVPVLRNCLFDKYAIEALEAIGDPSVVPDLEQIIAAGKPQQIPGSNADTDRRCIAAAKLAVATLKEGDPIPRYLALFDDPSFDEYQRADVIRRLGKKPDPRAIPRLLQAVKTDTSDVVVDNAIAVLGEYKYKEAVSGLIDCLDADISVKRNWKYAYIAEQFREHIAASLESITGKKLGPEKNLWLNWWNDTGERSFDKAEPSPSGSSQTGMVVSPLTVGGSTSGQASSATGDGQYAFSIVNVLDFGQRQVRNFVFCSATRQLFVSHLEGPPSKYDDLLYQWDIDSGHLLHKYHLGTGFICDNVAASPDGRHLLVGCWPLKGTECRTLLIDTQEKKIMLDLKRSDRIFDARFAQDGLTFWMLTSEERNKGIAFRLDGTQLPNFSMEEFPSPGSPSIWTVPASKETKGGLFYKGTDGVHHLLTSNNWHENSGITSDGKIIVTTTWDDEIIAWNAETLKEVFRQKITNHHNGGGYIAYDPKLNRFLIGDCSSGTTWLRALMIGKP